MNPRRRSLGLLVFVVLLLLSNGISRPGPASGATAEGQLIWAVHTTLVPAWFDP